VTRSPEPSTWRSSTASSASHNSPIFFVSGLSALSHSGVCSRTKSAVAINSRESRVDVIDEVQDIRADAPTARHEAGRND
jgi:hypothetical protein